MTANSQLLMATHKTYAFFLMTACHIPRREYHHNDQIKVKPCEKYFEGKMLHNLATQREAVAQYDRAVIEKRSLVCFIIGSLVLVKCKEEHSHSHICPKMVLSTFYFLLHLQRILLFDFQILLVPGTSLLAPHKNVSLNTGFVTERMIVETGWMRVTAFVVSRVLHVLIPLLGA